MSSLNRITLLGAVEDGLDIKATNSGDAMLKMQIKVERPKRVDGMVSGHDVIDVVAWRQVAEDNKDLVSGDLVLIEGKVITRVVEEAEGKKKWFTEVDARQCVKVTSGNLTDNESNNSSLETMVDKKVGEDDFNFGSLNEQSAPPKFSKELEADVPF